MEVLNIALQREIEAENYYRELAAQTEDIGLTNILNRLAQMEERHQRVVKAMIENNLDSSPEDDTFVADMKGLCKALEDNRSKPNLDDKQIELYKHAKTRELEAENLYSTAAEKAGDPAVAALLNRLAAQETMHAQILDSIIDFLAKAEPGGWLEDAEWYHTDVY